MDVFLILLGLVILCGVAYIVFKLSNNSNISLEESHEKKSEELKPVSYTHLTLPTILLV